MKKKYRSLTTSNHEMALRNFLAELVLFRRYHGKLPERFWTDSRWKWEYAREIKAISKFIKLYGEDFVYMTIKRNYDVRPSDFATMEVLLQKQMDRVARMLTPKDITPIPELEKPLTIDYRENIKRRKVNKGLFDKLKDIE